MAKTAASEAALGTLHRLMAEQFNRLLAGELKKDILDKEGNKVGEEVLMATAAELSVIRAFLKDNEITVAPNQGDALDKLRQRLADGVQGRPAMPVADFDLPGTVQ